MIKYYCDRCGAEVPANQVIDTNEKTANAIITLYTNERGDEYIQGLLTQIEHKDKAIERMRDLMRHYKAAYRTAYKLYQEARHDKLS